MFKLFFHSLFLFWFINQPLMAGSEVIKIGVLSHRGDAATAINWAATAYYLSQRIPDKEFRIVPLDFDEIEPSIQSSDIHFILVNPSIYVVMEVRHRITRIATLSRQIAGKHYDVFGGVIFALKERSDIKSLSGLKNKTMMAVDKTSLGGYQMAIRELNESGIDLLKDSVSIEFGGIHDRVVLAVLRGQVDVGTVRTGILESMHKKGLVDIQKFKIINQKTNDNFLDKHSTRLYPEWPFSKLRHTSSDLAQRVAIALMEMHRKRSDPDTDNLANRWSIPLEYQPVHELLKDLRLAPYQNLGQFTLLDALKKYWYGILSSLLFIIILAALTVLVLRLNRELKFSKQRLEQQHSLILDSVADGIYGVDLDGNSTFVNKAMERITGWQAKNIIGQNQHALLHHTKLDGGPHPEDECPVYNTYSDDKTRYIEDDLFWKSDGTSFPVEYTSAPLKDESDKTIGSVVIFRDISDQKKAEEDARRHQQELAHVARVSTMGEMASGMAHELNQPLTAISTNADACIRLVESQQVNIDKLGDVLEIINKQAKRASGIIQQLRNFVKKDLPEKNRVNLNDIVKEVLVLIRHVIESNSIQLDIKLEKDLPVVFAQHIQIDQVILNLVRNSIEAMSEIHNQSKRITITTEITEDRLVLVTIADNGPGIHADIKENLFAPFFTSKKNGMGLGLSISEGIISEHGGHLYLDDIPGKGAVFRFTLPTKF